MNLTWINKSFFNLFLPLFVFLADFLSKYFVHYHIPMMNVYNRWYPYGGIGIFKNFLGIEFSISHTINKGAAWGLFAQFQDYLLISRIILILGLLFYLFFFNFNNRYRAPLSFITVGAIGNIIDYFLYGHVIDMLHFVLWGYDFPVFNVADSAIFIGIIWLIILSWKDQDYIECVSKLGLGQRENSRD